MVDRASSALFLVADILIFHCFFDHSRIAQKSISLVERFDVAARIPEIYSAVHGRIAWRFEPFHSGAEGLRRGFEAGLSHGNSDMGLHCAVQAIKNLILCGANLRSLLKEIDYYYYLSEKYASELIRNTFLIFRETVSLLIDNGHATSIEAEVNTENKLLREAVLLHSAIRCFWLGQTERCQYFSEKCMSLTAQGGNSTSYVAKFYSGKMEGANLATFV
jgi:hypothetical protein